MDFFTLQEAVEGFFKEKGSKFIAYAFPIADEADFKEKLLNIKDLHPKATHHCYAYRLGFDGNQFRINDDGEPSGSAGKPILGQIDSFQLTNCAVVVVRYFGGTKLGIPRLIMSYKESTKLVLLQASLKKIIPTVRLKIHFTYSFQNKLDYLLQQINGQIIEKEFTENGVYIVDIPLPHPNFDQYFGFHENFSWAIF